MEYIVFDERRDGTGDTFTQEFDIAEDAVKEAKKQWNHLTAFKKKVRMVYALKSDAPDEESDRHFDGDYIWHSDFKCYKVLDTGVIWTEEEVRRAYEQFSYEAEAENGIHYESFEDYIEDMIRNNKLEEM